MLTDYSLLEPCLEWQLMGCLVVLVSCKSSKNNTKQEGLKSMSRVEREAMESETRITKRLTCCAERGLYLNTATLPVIAPGDDVTVEGGVDKSANLALTWTNFVAARRSTAQAKAITIFSLIRASCRCCDAPCWICSNVRCDEYCGQIRDSGKGGYAWNGQNADRT